MSWRLVRGPVPRGLNVKTKKSWPRTMTTIEPYALRVSVQRSPHSSVKGLTGHAGPEILTPDSVRPGRSYAVVRDSIPTDSEISP